MYKETGGCGWKGNWRMPEQCVRGSLFSSPAQELGMRLLAVVLSEGTCQELEPKWLYPVDYSTVKQVVGLVVCTNHLCYFSPLMSGCIKEATTGYSNPGCVVVRQLAVSSCLEEQ